MKNKKLTYLLIVVVLVVWGAIIYRIFNAAGAVENLQPLAVTDEPIVDAPAVEPTKFTLKLSYNDPFLGEVEREVVQEKTRPVAEEKKTPPIPMLKWPSVEYGGLIKNKGENKELAFIKVNGKGSIMSEGDRFMDVKLLKNFGDSIEVEFEKEKRFIKK